MELFLVKLEVALADGDFEFTPDEISQVQALALESILSSKSHKFHEVKR
jgi:hypothetical protein